ncbi:MAG TPA: A/G-specific adenine glycosylase [Bacilli bacterium]
MADISENGNGKFFAKHLLQWYSAGKRDLPWRRTNDPYRIWVSEIMLQQTRVDTVIPYYCRFLERFPTVQALAAAPEEEVLKLWEGLGYYSRARNLHKAARVVVENHGGIVPKDKEEMSRLPGVGPYTAGAVLSIAYDVAEPAVDGNVLRVLARFFGLADDIAKPAARKKFEALARTLLPAGMAGEFNQAVMELGALVCTPQSPSCAACPVREHCAARINGMVEQLPVKSKAKPPRPEHRIAALIVGSGANSGKIYVRRRPDNGLLAGMWELPHYFLSDNMTAKDAGQRDAALAEMARRLENDEGIIVKPGHMLLQVEHTFSHIRWLLDVYICREHPGPIWTAARNAGNPSALLAAEQSPQYGRHADWTRNERWIDLAEWRELPLSKAFQRIFVQLEKNNTFTKESNA